MIHNLKLNHTLKSMKKVVIVSCLCMISLLAFAQDNYPVVGISDDRPEIYGLKNAQVVVDHNQTLSDTDILIINGRIEKVGSNLTFPEGTVVKDLEGKTVYPSFIDLFTSYGLPAVARRSANQMAMMMGGQGQRTQTAERPRIADYWNQGIHESYDAVSEFKVNDTTAATFRKAGFGTVLTGKNDGLARGTSAMVLLTDSKAQEAVLMAKATTNYSLNKGSSEDRYPMAQYGSIALLRQMQYDAIWYHALPEGYFFDASLEALKMNKNLPKIFEVSDKYEVLRAHNIGKEFNIDYIIKGSGNEYQLLDEIGKSGVSLILPLNFPEAPDVKDPFDAARVGLSVLKHWEMAPSNPARVSKAGIEFSITAAGLRNTSTFLTNLRKAVEYGLDKQEALKALTYTPASMIGAEDLVGAVREGMVANLLITSGDIFDKDCKIFENWVGGKAFVIADLDAVDLTGSYKLKIDTASYDLSIAGTVERPTATIKKGAKDLTGAVTISSQQFTLSITTDKGLIRLSGPAARGSMKGEAVLQDGTWVKWSAETVPDTAQTAEKAKPENNRPGQADTSTGKVIYPFVSYGWEEKPVRENVLFQNATVWTLEEDGILEEADVLVEDGKIVRIGKELNAGRARVIDATGMHLTPGVIDEHSHIAMSSTNETGQVNSAEVRVGDIINPSDQSIYRQLSGGVTAAHILHGSANPVGGQSVLIKHRWGSSPEEMKIDGQVGFLKHALGENVKRMETRFPNSRMGTEHIIRDAYQRAVDYKKEWQAYNAMPASQQEGLIPPRRDLELDALVDVLDKKSFMACHTYVQSEGNMILKLAEDFGFKAHTLIHFNEGFKIADKIAEHGAACSVFSDWWNYKYEVYEGISYNAAALLEQGVLTCLHSDNAELSRRLHQEAGKIVKYGGIDEVEALKLVTLNPAKILHLDHRMGSIRAGKDADLVLWTGHPLSVFTRASKTMVDGIIYFDEQKDAEIKLKIEEERNRIIQKILKQSPAPAAGRAQAVRRNRTF